MFSTISLDTKSKPDGCISSVVNNISCDLQLLDKNCLPIVNEVFISCWVAASWCHMFV